MRLTITRQHPLEHGSILRAKAAAGVYDQNQPDQRFANIEIVFHQLQPLEANALRYLGESIARQIDQSTFRRQLEEIDELSAARRAARSVSRDVRPVRHGPEGRRGR